MRMGDTTHIPFTMRIMGSMRLMAAVRLVCTSSSKNSATELSIWGSAPVDSPTSTISDGQLGEDLGLGQADGEALALAHRLDAAEDGVADLAAVDGVGRGLQRGNSGRPPVSSVARVRAKSPTWYFSQTGPISGRPMRTRSTCSRLRPSDPADEEKDQQRQARRGHRRRSSARFVPRPARNVVITGSFVPNCS